MKGLLRVSLWLALFLVLAASGQALAQKYGGVLRVITASPPSLSIHEEATSRTAYPMACVYNNLVKYDEFQARETPDTIIPELAERWEWRNGNKDLWLKLHRGVTWHDGKPFTAKDVKHTWDVVRGVVKARMKLNPRKLWYFNVADIVTNGDYEVTFKLRRPQPSLLAMLAAGYSPVYPAHVPPQQLRTQPLGTGPFKMVTFKRDQIIKHVKNLAYWKKDRPYLDGIDFQIIRSRSSGNAALLAGQADVNNLTATPKPVYLNMKQANKGLVFTELITNTTANIIMNTNRAPFNDPVMRRAVSLALDRRSLIRSVYDGAAKTGGALIPSPGGNWGLTPEQLRTLPGYGDPKKNKAEARRLLAGKGYGPKNPFKLEVKTNNRPLYMDPAVWALGELKEVGIQAELKPIEGGNWYGVVARRDFDFAMNATAVGIDDPDAAFYENYKCGSQRNYTDFCNKEVEALYDKQSIEVNQAKRKGLVQKIDMMLQNLGARPMLIYRVDFYARQPYVKNFIPHQSVYNAWRFEVVWLDK